MSGAGTADPAGLDVVGLTDLMQLTSGIAQVGVGLVDGPVLTGHPDLADADLRFLGPVPGPGPAGRAAEHATFLAGILAGRRGSWNNSRDDLCHFCDDDFDEQGCGWYLGDCWLVTTDCGTG